MRNESLRPTPGRRLIGFPVIFLGVVVCSVFAHQGRSDEAGIPRTVLWDGAYMARLRAHELRADPDVEKTFARLRDRADEALELGPLTVTAKKAVPPSGDIHDYQSFSRYWWPNPETDDGLPYIRKDGQVNRKLVQRGDRTPLGDLVDAVPTLSLAYYFLGDREAGERAVKLVETWFLDPATR